MCDINWHQGQLWMISQYIPHIRWAHSTNTQETKSSQDAMHFFSLRTTICNLTFKREIVQFLDGCQGPGETYWESFWTKIPDVPCPDSAAFWRKWTLSLPSTQILHFNGILMLGSSDHKCWRRARAWEFSQELQAKSVLYTHFYPLLF